MEWKRAVADLAAAQLGLPTEDVLAAVEYPPNPALGDLALPCFRFAKVLRQNPVQLAAAAGAALRDSGRFASVEVTGGYVNVRLNRQEVAARVLELANSDPAGLYSRRRHAGDKVAVDYSSPNIAKPFGVGHLRSTMIGQAICRLLAADGFTVLGINHLGDWGTQFGKNIVAYLRWGDEQTVRRDPVRELFRLYVRFHEEAKDHPELEDEARVWFKKLEDGDATANRLWQWFIQESLRAFEQTYQRLGVKFDYVLGESFYNDKMQAVIEELQARGLLTESEGAE
ncbi:MAG: arginine--tRNA ligase, partial [Alicyclobacillus sp.]|nr:arginine--tRNA ligase [Alicyclobacillus sp.]